MSNPLLEDDDRDVSNEEVCMISTLGQAVFCLVGLCLFVAALSNIDINGVNDVPPYAKSIMYYSLGYHFEDVRAQLNSVSPPPPSF